MINKIIEPKTLSLITTEQCTAACHNCCFQCSPHKRQRMSLKEMMFYIDEVIRDFPEVVACVFTGGECTTLGSDLIKILEYSQSNGFKNRIVTNGHWASNEVKALNYLKRLKDSGLKELNLSTGDEHQKWIPFDKIVYACKAAVKIGMFVAVNIESTPQSIFTSKNMMEDKRISNDIVNGKIVVKDSLWIEFSGATHNFKEKEVLNEGACVNLFNTISITPNGYLQACCGLTCKNNKYLTLGNIQNHSLRRLYEEQFDDLIKLWLYTHGPKKIYTFLCHEKGCEDSSFKYPHICSLCNHILKDDDNMNIIQSKISDILPSVLLKYQFINNTNM